MTFGEKLHENLALLDMEGTAYEIGLCLHDGRETKRLGVMDHGPTYITCIDDRGDKSVVTYNTAYVAAFRVFDLDAGE